MDELLQHARRLAEQSTAPLFAPVQGRVAYVVSHAPSYASNGYAVRTQGIAEALNQQGLETLCLVRPGRPWELGLTGEAFPLETTLRGVRYIHSRWSSGVPKGENARLRASAERFLELFRVYRPQVVLAASNWIVGLPSWIAAQRLGLPFYNEVRGFWELSRCARDPQYTNTLDRKRSAERDAFVAGQARKVFTLNQPMKEELARRGVDVSSIDLVPNGVNEPPVITPSDPLLKARLGIQPEDRVVGYVGSFTAYEGMDTLLEACAELAEKYENLKLLLVGDDQPLISTSGVNVDDKGKPWLIQVGRVPHEQVADYYALIDAVVIPRKKLPVCELVPPIKVAEALAYGKRLVVSNVAPLLEYAQQNESVLTFEAGQPKSLAASLQNALFGSLPGPGTVTEMQNYITPLFEALHEERGHRKNNKFEVCNERIKTGEEIIGSSVDRSNEAGSVEFRNESPGAASAKTRAEICVGRLLEAAKRKKDSNRPEDESLLLGRASEFDRSPRILKAAFWSAIRAKKTGRGKRLLDQLEATLTDSAKNREWLVHAHDRLLKKSVSEEDIESMLTVRNRRGIESIPNRLCYVLHFSLPYSSNGYATRAHGIAVGFRAAGWDAICITRPGFPRDLSGFSGGEVPELQEVDGIQYHVITSPDRQNFKGLDYVVEAARAVKDKLIDLQPEVVMAASNHITALPAQIAARELGLPFIYEVRGFWEVTRVSREPEFQETPQYKELVRRETLSAYYADHVFTLTEPMRSELTLRGVSRDKITLLPNSVNPSQFRSRPRDETLASNLGIPEGVPVIGYIGSFVQYEGLDDLAQACAMLAERGVEFRLMLVGNENASGNDRGPITAKIERIADQEGLSDKLIMTGRIDHEAVAAHYSLIDIAPFPRKPQPVTEMVSPMKPLEAFAMEKVVVVSSVRALTEMVTHEKTGLIFEKGNVESLADTLQRLCGDSAMRARLGKAGRKWVMQERTWEKTAKLAVSTLASEQIFPKCLEAVKR